MKKINTRPEHNIIGENVRQARERANMSQKLLSEKLELIPVYICRGSISRIENGSRAITDIEINAIAHTLKVSPNELFDWTKHE